VSAYKALVERLELRPIKNEKELEAALAMAEELFLKLVELNEDEQDYLKVLSDLITAYENAVYGDFPKAGTPIENLKFLMEENDIKQSDLARLLNVTSSRAGELLSGARDLTKSHVSILAQRFKVDAALFLPLVQAGAISDSTMGSVDEIAENMVDAISHLSGSDRELVNAKLKEKGVYLFPGKTKSVKKRVD